MGIFSIAEVVADQHHAIDRVLVVDAVSIFPIRVADVVFGKPLL